MKDQRGKLRKDFKVKACSQSNSIIFLSKVDRRLSDTLQNVFNRILSVIFSLHLSHFVVVTQTVKFYHRHTEAANSLNPV